MVVGGACGLRRLWTCTLTAAAFLVPKGLRPLLLKLNGPAKQLLRDEGAFIDTVDARIGGAESITEETACSNCSVDFARDTLWGLGGWWGTVGGKGITGSSMCRSTIVDEDEHLWLSCQIRDRELENNAYAEVGDNRIELGEQHPIRITNGPPNNRIRKWEIRWGGWSCTFIKQYGTTVDPLLHHLSNGQH